MPHWLRTWWKKTNSKICGVISFIQTLTQDALIEGHLQICKTCGVISILLPHRSRICWWKAISKVCKMWSNPPYPDTLTQDTLIEGYLQSLQDNSSNQPYQDTLIEDHLQSLQDTWSNQLCKKEVSIHNFLPTRLIVLSMLKKSICPIIYQ